MNNLDKEEKTKRWNNFVAQSLEEKAKTHKGLRTELLEPSLEEKIPKKLVKKSKTKKKPLRKKKGKKK